MIVLNCPNNWLLAYVSRCSVTSVQNTMCFRVRWQYEDCSKGIRIDQWVRWQYEDYSKGIRIDQCHRHIVQILQVFSMLTYSISTKIPPIATVCICVWVWMWMWVGVWMHRHQSLWSCFTSCACVCVRTAFSCFQRLCWGRHQGYPIKEPAQGHGIYRRCTVWAF